MSLDTNRDHTLDEDAGVSTEEIDDNAITDAKIASHTTTKITVPISQIPSGTADQIIKTNIGGTALEYGLIGNANIGAGAAIDLSKLATDPLARANHTGSQTASTISDFATAVGSSTSTLTNKTFDANGTGNSITNIENADISTSAGIVVTKIANGTANQVVKTNTGGTALEHGLLANANIDASAAISITKLANGTANQVVKTNAGGTALEFGTLANDNLASGVFSNITGIGTQAQTLDMNANLIDNVSDIATGTISDETNTVSVFTITDTTGAVTLEQDMTIADATDIILNATTGTKIGTATTQKIAFYNSTPIVQPAGTGETIGFTAGAGTAVLDDSTFTGNVGSTAYRISDVVKALKNLGLLAQ